MTKLKDKKLFLLDMDGTIYLDNDLFDGTVDFLSYVKSIGGRYMFLTNNSSKGVTSYMEKMAKMGIETAEEDFFTSVNATILDLKDKNYKKIYVFGTKSFKEQMEKAGFKITDTLEDDIDCLLMGFDTELCFKKLEDACILLGRGVDYIATNPDWVCPTCYGYVPDCGSVAEMLYNATKRRPRFIGKPEPDMVYHAMAEGGCTKEETVIIGDRIYTDIACGINAGIDQIMVLSGESTLEDIEKYDIHPAFIYKDIREILNEISK